MAVESEPKSETSVNAAPQHEIILVQTREERQQCYNVRIAVFHVEQKFPLETEIDEWDAGTDAAHFLLRLKPSLTPIGTIRACRGKNYYKLTRLAILKDYRKYRFGAYLVHHMHAWVAKDAASRLQQQAPQRVQGQDDANGAPLPASVDVVCHSQIPVKGFYAKFGYTPEGAEFDEDGDPHQKMVLRLPLSLGVESTTGAIRPSSAGAGSGPGAGAGATTATATIVSFA